MITINAPKFSTMEEMAATPRSYLTAGCAEADAFAKEAIRQLVYEGDTEGLVAIPYGTFGRAAITSAIRVAGARGHIVAANNLFPGTWAYLNHMAIYYSWQVDFIDDINNTAELTEALSEDTRLVICETTSNPTLVVTDLRKLVATVAQHASGAVILVDDTVNAGALLADGRPFSPLRLSADIVAYSCSKHIAAQGDERGGLLIGAEQTHPILGKSLMQRLSALQRLEGSHMHPSCCVKLTKRIKEVQRRQSTASANAFQFAYAFEALGAKVYYPGLKNHPTYQNAIRNGLVSFGGLVTLDMDTAANAAALGNAWAKAGIVTPSNSFGEKKTLAEAVVYCLPQHKDLFAQMGIPEGTLRLSLGWGIDPAVTAPRQAEIAANILKKYL